MKISSLTPFNRAMLIRVFARSKNSVAVSEFIKFELNVRVSTLLYCSVCDATPDYTFLANAMYNDLVDDPNRRQQ